MTMSQKYRLVYFPFAARGEGIRMTLSAAGVDFDDERITFEQWGTLKPTIPSRQLPALYTPCGKVLSQSGAICQFIARQHGLFSNDDWEVYYIEQALGIYEDMITDLLKIHFTKDEAAKAALIKDFTEGKAPNCFRQLVERLDEMAKKGGFLAGTAKPTLADVLLVNALDFTSRMFPELVTKETKLCDHRNKVLASLPKLADYLKKRPVTQF